jgi:hypothetical protein
MNPERTSEELDKFAQAFHVASRIHGEHVKKLGEEAGDLVTIAEYDRALREVGLGQVVDRRDRLSAENTDLVSSENVQVTA